MRHFRETSGIHKVKKARAITRFWDQKTSKTMVPGGLDPDAASPSFGGS